MKKILASFVLLSSLNLQLSTFAQGTSFTYQGRLNAAGAPANGTYDFQFILFSQSQFGNPAAPILTNANVFVSNGLFTTTLDFGGVFAGTNYWLDISVRTNGAGAFTELVPRQPLTPAPYAIMANSASNLLGTLPSGRLSGLYSGVLTFGNAANTFDGTYFGDGSGLTSLNANNLSSGTVPDARLAANIARTSQVWLLGGNAGANPTNGNFLGTTDNLPLEFKVNGMRVLRFTQNTNGAPNVIGGSSINFVSNGVVGATISGGGTLNYYSYGPSTNSVTANYGAVGGGTGNTASGFNATVSGGGFNIASGSGAMVGGGYNNVASGPEATIAGGEANVADGSNTTIGGGNNNYVYTYAQAATVAGGDQNTCWGFASTVPGGFLNTALGWYSFAAGTQAKADHDGAFVWADSQGIDFASTSTNQFLIRAQGGVGINNNNPRAPLHVTSGGDASLNSGGNIISGLVSGQNLVIDNNEIISRNNGAASDLILNFGSGNVGIGRNPGTNRLEVGGEASKATAGNWLANSDARIKTGVQTVTGALDKLARVRLVQFRYTDDYRAAHPGVEDREYLNVIAQEFQRVFPEEVKKSGEKLANGDDILQVDTYPLTIYSAAAVQELSQKLTTELKRRDAENAELKQRIETLERIICSQK